VPFGVLNVRLVIVQIMAHIEGIVIDVIGVILLHNISGMLIFRCRISREKVGGDFAGVFFLVEIFCTFFVAFVSTLQTRLGDVIG